MFPHPYREPYRPLRDPRAGHAFAGLAGALLLAALACNSPAITGLTPKTGPGTDYPCGVEGLVCTTNGVPNHTCCTEGDACGATDPKTQYPSLAEDPSCFAGECCDVRQVPAMAKRPKRRAREVNCIAQDADGRLYYTACASDGGAP